MRATCKVYKVGRDKRQRAAALDPIQVEAPSKDALRGAAQIALASVYPELVASISFVKSQTRPGHMELVAYLHEVPQRARKNVRIAESRVRR